MSRMTAYYLVRSPENLEYCEKNLNCIKPAKTGYEDTYTHLALSILKMQYLKVEIRTLREGQQVITLDDLDAIRLLPTAQARYVYLREIYCVKNDPTQDDN